MATATNVITAVPPWVAAEEPRATDAGETPRLEFQTPVSAQCECSRMSLRRSDGELPRSQAIRRPGCQSSPGDVGFTRCRQAGSSPNHPGRVHGCYNGLADARWRQGRRPPPRTLRCNFHRPEFLPKALKIIECLLRSVMLSNAVGRFALLG